MSKKAKLKVLVKIHTLTKKGDEDELVRQFDVEVKLTKKVQTLEQLAFAIGKAIDKKYGISNVESFTV